MFLLQPSKVWVVLAMVAHCENAQLKDKAMLAILNGAHLCRPQTMLYSSINTNKNHRTSTLRKNINN